MTSKITTKKQAFWSGFRYTLGSPVLVLFAGMIGFGAMGHAGNLPLWLLNAISLLIFALPGQVLMLEMLASSASFIATALAVTLTSTRFITMALTLFPQLSKKDQNNKLYVYVHLLAMTAWAISMKEFPKMESKYRLSYFLGVGFPCWLIAIPGTVLGYFLAGNVPYAVALTLVFINPLFFLMTFTDIKPWGYRLAVLLGGLLGPVFFMLDKDSSLLSTGLVAGTVAYWIDRQFLRRKV